ncbi:MAG: hypothetical protein E5V51_00310 [Mesorhizobium sp.]|nr:hypothetical protein EOA35_09385 [Mesorhizobium sp. M8A.F.Ca.ET.023.01.1.1]TIW90647.1 MAG: hypothetical protein E5V51_00310 [Mesorhizobium sp.]
MSEIPAEVMKAALDAAWAGGIAAKEGNNLTVIIARAILAERERCAKIAAEWKSPLRPGTEARRLGHDEAAHEIARKIRGQNDG